MRHSSRASLATTYADDGDIWPYASLVMVACDVDLAPLVFISKLAVHTSNLGRDRRASLLFDATLGLAEPLTGPRATVIGRFTPFANERGIDRYIRYQPSAVGYREFNDFGLWRLTPERVHLVAGFGRISWIEPTVLLPDPAAAATLAAAESAVVGYLNDAQKRAVDRCGERLRGGKAGGWSVIGVDCDGADLRSDDLITRVEFGTSVSDGNAAINEFMRLSNGDCV
jgi:putative heme iron utilization protein